MLLTSINLNLTQDEKRILVQTIKQYLHRIPPIPTPLSPRLSKLSGIKGIVFDVYGTLLVSGSGEIGTVMQSDRSHVLCQALTLAGFVVKNNTVCENGIVYFHSMIARHHKVLRAKGIAHPEIDILEIWSETTNTLVKEKLLQGKQTKMSLLKLSVIYESLSNPLWVMPGFSEMISAVQKRYILGIISNAQFYTPLMFNALLQNDIEERGFNKNLLYYSYRFKRAKPSLFMFEKMKKQLYNQYMIKQDEILYVGNDMLNDVAAASKCGYKTALFAGDNRSLRLRNDTVTGILPDVILTDLRQLKDVLS